VTGSVFQPPFEDDLDEERRCGGNGIHELLKEKKKPAEIAGLGFIGVITRIGAVLRCENLPSHP